MRDRKRIWFSTLVCAGLFALALLAGQIPFAENPEAEYGADPVPLFSAEYFRNFLPLLAILLASAGGILLVSVIRRGLRGAAGYGTASRLRARGGRLGRNEYPGGNGRSGRSILFGGELVPGQKKLGFAAVRWTVMIVSAFCMMFGGTVLGLRFADISLPVFSCAINTTQLTETSCYFLSHLPELFEELPMGGVMMFFVTTIGSALLLGRMLCGFLCPMGMVQDVVHALRLKTRGEGVAMTDRAYEAWKPVKWLMVFLMLGLFFLGGNFCAFCPVAAISPILAGVRVSLYFSGFALIFVLIGSYFKRRFFCMICPLGVLLGMCHKVSPFRIKKDCQACTECGVCYEACPMGIQAIYTERGRADVTEAACIFCGECVRKCPEDNALSMTVFGKPFYTASRKQALSGYETIAKQVEKEQNRSGI